MSSLSPMTKGLLGAAATLAALGLSPLMLMAVKFFMPCSYLKLGIASLSLIGAGAVVSIPAWKMAKNKNLEYKGSFIGGRQE